jgi:predicted transcriptional regulator
MAKSKFSITVDRELVEQIQQLPACQSQPLSQIVEKALEEWYQAQLAAEMEAGYREWADFDLALAEADMAAVNEVWPDA